ncbi:MAG: 50S ribosomal protein L31 [Candidatus Schekmanbacteria bacterium]|nr:50S ribosomal protein L31 [Candidatus Schekmanbacteria bacterium]
MKKGIHPEYKETNITCTCGNIVKTKATKENIHIEICSSCHPFFTGKQKFIDAAGRVERFKTRYGSDWKRQGKGTKQTEEAVAVPVGNENNSAE